MTRQENILTLNEHLEHWKRLLSEKICDQDEGEKTIDALQNAIKALEQDPCADMVSRDAMWDVLQRLYGTEGELVEELMSLPPVLPMPKIGKWIPVEAALPEVGSEVLVCYEFKKHRSVYIANFYGDGKFHGLDDEYLTTEGRKYRKAVAWMPMPTPPNKSEIPTGAEGSEKE